jgi:hypothetical protein
MSESPDGLIEASGRGSELFTELIIFYFQNRAVIDQWAKLQEEAGPITSLFMQSHEDELADLVAPWETWTCDLRRYRVLMSSPLGITHSGPPSAGIALGWHKTIPMTPEEPVETCPFVGVYADPNAPVHAALMDALAEKDDGKERRDSWWWPRYEYVTQAGYWWSDLDAYSEKLVKAFRKTFAHYGSALESAFKN